MNPIIKKLLAVLALLAMNTAWSIEPDEVRQYDDVFAISAFANEPGQVTIAWDIAENYFLYNNRFLAFSSVTPGIVLGEPDIPEGKKTFDELLGEEVIKFKDRLEIVLPLSVIPTGLTTLELEIRSQGCLEAVLCYPPSRQFVSIDLPAGSPGAARSPLDELLGVGALAPATGAPALPADEAFVFEAIARDAGTVLVRFTAQPGYYLYVDQFGFSVAGSDEIRVAAVDLPAGTIKDDPEFGRVPVIFDQVEIPVSLARPAGDATTIDFEAAWQGCRDGDICYPPQTGSVEVVLPAISEPIVAASSPLVSGTAPGMTAGAGVSSAGLESSKPAPPVSEQSRLATLLVENPPVALLAFFVAGMLLAFTPCVFPMVPILSGIIAGEGDRMTTSRALTLSVVYVLAMALTYTVAGVLAGLFGQNLQAMFQNPWIIGSFAGVFVLLSLSMFGFYELQLPSSWQTRLVEQSNRQKGGRLGGVAVMGVLSALIVGPCVAPPLAAALIVIGESGSAVLGGSALFAMSLGMGVPLIAFGVGAGKFLPRAGMWMNAIKAVFGVGLLALAIWMLERILPGGVIMVLWGLLAIACAIYLGALERVPDGASGWARLWKALGVALLLFGAIQFTGAASGGDYWLRPLAHLAGQGVNAGDTSANKVEFRRIASVDELRDAVAQANATGQPAMLDFYADWCVECIRMERNTFPEPGVQALMAQLQPIKADVTQNNAVDQELMRTFGIIGPPAILFFGRDGQEMEDYRLVGYFNPEAFSAHLQQVLAAQ